MALVTPSPRVPCHPVPCEALWVAGDSPGRGGAPAFRHRGRRGDGAGVLTLAAVVALRPSL